MRIAAPAVAATPKPRALSLTRVVANAVWPNLGKWDVTRCVFGMFGGGALWNHGTVETFQPPLHEGVKNDTKQGNGREVVESIR